jgi:drug/metabolite transporter (DMT)-like permease
VKVSTRSHLFLIIAGLLFGANYWIVKAMMPTYFSPEQLMLPRLLGAGLLFFIFDFFVPHKQARIEKPHMLRLAVAALFGVALNQYLFFAGLNMTTPVDAALIHVLNPILVLIFAALVIGERFTTAKGIGVLLGAMGAGFIILYGKELSFSSRQLTGNLLIFANTVAYAIYLILIKPMMEHYSPVRIMKWIFIFGTLYVFPFTIGPTLQINYQSFTPFIWFAICYVIIATTFVAYLLTTSALKHLNASVVSFYIYMQPIIAAVIAVFAGKESLHWWQAPAALAIFTGVYLITRKEKLLLKSEPEKQTAV